MRIILLTFLFLRLAGAAPLGAPELERRLTLKVHDAPVLDVLQVIADDLDKSLLVLSEVRGDVSLNAQEVRSAEILSEVVRARPGGPIFVVTPDFLIVAPPDRIRQAMTPELMATPDRHRVFHLATAPANKIVEFLQGQYLSVRFGPVADDPQSFIAVGPQRDLVSIASELPNLDRIPEPPQEPRLQFKLSGPQRFRLVEDLRERFYGSSFQLDGEWLMVTTNDSDAPRVREAVQGALRKAP